MNEQDKKKKGVLRSKTLKFAFFSLAIILFMLYLLDKYIIPDRVSVYLTREPSVEEKKAPAAIKEPDAPPEESNIERKPQRRMIEGAAVSDKPPAAPPRRCFKTVGEMSKLLSFKYPEWSINEWNYNLERGKGQKISKSVFGSEELSDWNSDMLGDENAVLLKKGAAEFIKLEDEAFAKAQKEKEKPKKAKGAKTTAADQGEANNVDAETKAEQDANPQPDKEAPAKLARGRIDQYSYKLLRFAPGLADDGCFQDYEGLELADVVKGKPDFAGEGVTRPEVYKVQFLPLGNGGSAVFEVLDGDLVDGEGPDFVIYGHTAFMKGVKTAKVEVAERDAPGEYVEFPCDSVIPPFRGCAGIHPVTPSKSTDPILVGGDPFDLAKTGIKKARFIRISDTGDNKNMAGFVNTDGFDLDSIALIHAFKK